jgi:hypothetical protein
MTVLGAVVFGGLLALAVLWLLATAPDSDIDQAWSDAHWTEHVDVTPDRGVLAGTR